jgi:two-component system nitrate/nitrite response regulator NarL
MSVKVLLVEDHEIVRQGVRSLLEGEAGIEISGEANNGEEAIKICEEKNPDVVLMDMNMPVMNGLECTRVLNEKMPFVKVLILSMHDYENYLIDMLDAGADGYVLKTASKDELVFAIKKINSGSIYISPEFTLAMLQKYKSGLSTFKKEESNVTLSQGEGQVLSLIAEGCTNTEMANRLFISVRTVESRRKRLLRKTGASNSATLIKYAIKHGLVN